MMREIKTFLRSLELRVMLLDGNLTQRGATLQEFERGGVLLLCLDDCFAGLHLPHAQHVVFAHAIVGDRNTVERLERQAVSRCARAGQTQNVKVHSFVISDTAEEVQWRVTHE
jgi:SNF2 family DNA or RNA helicase